MPRTARAVEVGTIYHILNRGNGRMKLFHKPGDYAAFLKVLAQALQRYPVDLLLPDAQSLAPRRAPQAAGRAGAIHGMGRRHPCAAPSPTLSSSGRRPPVSRAVQELSRSGRSLFPQGLPLRGGQRRARPTGAQRGSLALERPGSATGQDEFAGAGRVAGGSAGELESVSECGTGGDGACFAAAVRSPRPAVRR